VVMRRVPRDVHREVLARRDDQEFSDEPTWYAVWLGPPHGEKSHLLGQTQRMLKPRWWRAFPATGEPHRELRGWISVAEWFLEVREQHKEITESE